MLRRSMLLGLAAAATFGPTLASAAETKHVALAKAFQFLDLYLALAPAQRSRFYLAYRAMRDRRPAPDLKAVIVEANGTRAPLELDRAGYVTRLPGLAELKGGASLEIEAGAGEAALGVEIRPDVAASIHPDVGELTLALAQAVAAETKIAGALSILAPKFDAAFFPDAGAGQAILADGRAMALPVISNRFLGVVPYFRPGAMAGARSLALARAPSRILLGSHPG